MSALERLKAEYLKESEAAELLAVKMHTLRCWRSRGTDHPPCVKVGRSVLYPVQELQKWLKAKEQRPLRAS